MSKHQPWLKDAKYKKTIKALEVASFERQTIMLRHKAERESSMAAHKAAREAVNSERRRVLEGMPVVTIKSRATINVECRLLAVLKTQVVIWIESGVQGREVRFTRGAFQWWDERGASYSGLTLDSYTLPVGARCP